MVPFCKLASYVILTDSVMALCVLVLSALLDIRGGRPGGLQLCFLKKKQILERLDPNKYRRLLGIQSGRWCRCNSHVLNSLQGLCLCVLNLSCIMQKCIFLNFFFHSGHGKYAFLTCFLISVAIFFNTENQRGQEFTQQVALISGLVVDLDQVLL